MRDGSLREKVLGTRHPHDKVVKILTDIGPRGKLLDAPAGTGALSRRLKEAGFEVLAVDIEPSLFGAEGISCLRANLNAPLPFPDESFEFVLCSNGIEHLEDPFQFIRECYRVLKTKGKLLITTPNLLNLKARLANLLVGFNLFTGRPCNEVDAFAGGEHIHLANYFELRVMLHRNGFRILKVTTHQYSNTAMVLFFLFPLIYLATYRAFQRERNPLQRERNREIFRHTMSADLIFGKKLFLLAEKDPGYLRTG
ncbi:MAG: class I SAM-dependent methyltransferase [Desulfobacterota bacterium]|nr:class I SAM-dependent methyltransferase [Thermodesulfobacteriota bacterium]